LYIKKKWLEYGFDNVELKRYQVLLSFPEKAGVVTIQAKNGSELYKTSAADISTNPAYNDSRVFPPFNAYSPAGSVKVTQYLKFLNNDQKSELKRNVLLSLKMNMTCLPSSDRQFAHNIYRVQEKS
jgi:archaellin